MVQLLKRPYRYTEAVHIVYTTNQFCFNETTTWDSFTSIVPSYYKDSIRDLHVQLMCRYPYRSSPVCSINRGFRRQPKKAKSRKANSFVPQPIGAALQKEETWVALWQSIGSMRGLKMLDVKLVDMPWFWKYKSKVLSDHTYQLRPDEGDELEMDILLDPLREIRGLEEFVVELPQFYPVRAGDPFTVIYPEDVIAVQAT